MKPANPIIHSFILIIILNICLPLISTAGTVNLPQTGQTTCYDTSGSVIPCTNTGQDGDIRAGVVWPVPRFTDNGDGTITDNLTRLVWTQDANLPARAMTWQVALDYVAGLNAGSYLGYTDWRLPNVNELESLVNAEEANPATWLGTQGFTNVQSKDYWSSTSYASNTFSSVWLVHMSNGFVGYDVKNVGSYVWPVRSGSGGSFGNSDIWKTGQTTSYAAWDDGISSSGVAWPSPRFTVNGDGTITDNLTGLLWTQDANLPGGTNWQQALDYIKGMNAGTYPNLGYTDWRLPNRKELFSLIDRSKSLPAIQTGHPFTNVQSLYYWSSTSYASSTFYVWSVFMGNGRVDGYNKATTFYVWPVRSGSGGSFGNSDISVSPNSKDFGNVNIGGSSSPQGFIISNTGSADLIIGTISLTGTDTSEYNIQNDTCTGATITPSATCTLDVVFSPATGGIKSANLSIPSNDPDTPTLNVPLSGTGTGTDLTLDIKANNSDGPLTIGTDDVLSVAISLSANDHAGQASDWWVVADTPSGLQSFDLNQGFVSGLSVTNQGVVFNLGSATILNTSGLTNGAYTYYFGIDLDQDGALDMTEGLFYYDSVEVAVVTNTHGLSPPTEVTASSSGATVTISWDTVSGADGYMLYFGFSSGVYAGTFDLGNLSSMVFDNIPEGTYYLAITAYAGTEESGYSNEASVTVMSGAGLSIPTVLRHQ